MISLALFFVIGLILIYQARTKLITWSKYEAMTRDYDVLAKIKQDYEAKYYKKKGRVDDARLVDKIQYFVTRLSFINPVYLPTLTESYLRKWVI